MTLSFFVLSSTLDTLIIPISNFFKTDKVVDSNAEGMMQMQMQSTSDLTFSFSSSSSFD